MSLGIHQIVERRKITAVLHFTKVENLASIMKYGLQPLDVLRANNIRSVNNDLGRFDHTQAVCASISFPNYQTFYKFQQADRAVRWVIIAMHPKILWETDCAFCVRNAAHATQSGIPLNNRKGEVAFSKMFDDFGEIKRTSLGIPDNFTTNPQAEVLLLQGAPLTQIFGLIFPNTHMETEFKAIYDKKRYPGIWTYAKPNLFSYRSDWNVWKA